MNRSYFELDFDRDSGYGQCVDADYSAERAMCAAEARQRASEGDSD